MHKIKEIEKIGEGSFGKVFKALDLTDNTEVAVKVLNI
jgi:calcium/calmodulin-dependent protein kinase I